MLPESLFPTNAFVAIFDIVAFKRLREKKGTAGLYQQFKRGLLPMIQHAAAGRGKQITHEGRNIYVPDFNEFSCAHIIISDTVMFFTPDDSWGSFMNIIRSSRELLTAGFAMNTPFRGAIGHGDLIADPPIYIGQAIEDAHLGEQSQMWAGCMLTHTCDVFVRKHHYPEQVRDIAHKMALEADTKPVQQRFLNLESLLVEYDVPTQSWNKETPVSYGTLTTHVLDWTPNISENLAAKSFEKSTKPHAQKIVANTEAFETWARKRPRPSL